MHSWGMHFSSAEQSASLVQRFSHNGFRLGAPASEVPPSFGPASGLPASMLPPSVVPIPASRSGPPSGIPASDFPASEGLGFGLGFVVGAALDASAAPKAPASVSEGALEGAQEKQINPKLTQRIRTMNHLKEWRHRISGVDSSAIGSNLKFRECGPSPVRAASLWQRLGRDGHDSWYVVARIIRPRKPSQFPRCFALSLKSAMHRVSS